MCFLIFWFLYYTSVVHTNSGIFLRQGKKADTRHLYSTAHYGNVLFSEHDYCFK